MYVIFLCHQNIEEHKVKLHFLLCPCSSGAEEVFKWPVNDFQVLRLETCVTPEHLT